MMSAVRVSEFQVVSCRTFLHLEVAEVPSETRRHRSFSDILLSDLRVNMNTYSVESEVFGTKVESASSCGTTASGCSSDHGSEIGDSLDSIVSWSECSDSCITVGGTSQASYAPAVIPSPVVVADIHPEMQSTSSKTKSRSSRCTAARGKQVSHVARARDGCTTLVLKKLPQESSQRDLCETLDTLGFAGRYDFFYAPTKYKAGGLYGYAVVNFLCHDIATAALLQLPHGFGNISLDVSWCQSHQGLQALIDRYRNLPVMHPDVPHELKPILLHDGAPMTFPSSTKEIRAPRLT